MFGAENIFQIYGPSVFKGIAVAGVGGAIISRFIMTTAEAESPVKDGKKVFGRAGPVFTRLTLEKSEDVNHNTKKLSYKLPGENDVSGLPLTGEFPPPNKRRMKPETHISKAALLSVSWPSGQTIPVLRPYTPISHSSQPGTVDFLVKRYPNGKQSTHLHSLSPGDSTLFAVVIPGFKWTPNLHDSVTLIAGGAGITPAYQLIQGILSNPADKTKIRLVFGVNSEEDILLRKEFENYEAKYGRDRFQAVYSVSSGGQSVDGQRFRKGYVTEELLREVAVPATEGNTKVMICGPPAMEEALLGKKGWVGRQQGILGRLGYKKDQIHQF